jgi:hypothetical protein
MRNAVIICVAIAVSGVVGAVDAAEGASVIGVVEAVYHEGLVTFRVEHPDAVSIGVRVFDLEGDELLYDSQPRRGTVVTWPAGRDVNGRFRFAVTAWDVNGEVVVSQAATSTNLTPIIDINFNEIPTDTTLVADTVVLEGDTWVGNPHAALVDQSVMGLGAGLYLFDDTNVSYHTAIEPDFDGNGGFLWVVGGNGSGVRLQGDHFGNQAALAVDGTSDFYVRAGETGDNSVVMPLDAVSDLEIIDEPGVASMIGDNLISISTSGPNTVLARTIVTPTSGHVLVMAVVKIGVNVAAGDGASVNCGVTLSGSTIPGDGQHSFMLPSGAPGGWYITNINPMRIYPDVSAGVHTYYVSCQSAYSANAYDRHLAIAFFPTAYGGISEEAETFGDRPTPDFSPEQIAAEREDAVAVNLRRIKSEVDALQAQIDAIELANPSQR